MDKHCSDARYIKNLALEQAKMYRPEWGPTPNNAMRSLQLTEAREAFAWLREGSASVQQQALREFNQAMKNFFSGKAGFPTWWVKGRDESFCIRDVQVKRLNTKWSAIDVPKCGYVKFRTSRPLPAKYGMAHVTKDRSARWHVSFTAEQPQIARVSTLRMIGIDRGVSTTIATSDKQMFRIPTCPKLIMAIMLLSQTRSRQRKGSARGAGTRLAIAKLWARITDRRNDWIEKMTTWLVTNYDVIVLENLPVKNMVHRAKPKEDPNKPGSYIPNGAAAKSGLNRVILQSCWSMFLTRLQQKAAVSGVIVILVNPQYTSQECRKCHHTASENRKSQAEFRCVSCGHANHADINAAENILDRGLVVLYSNHEPLQSEGLGRMAA